MAESRDMYLYQLAWEIGEEPPVLAARAQALGLGSLDPSDDLTGEQEATLRAAYPAPAAAPASAPVESISFTTPGSQAQPPPEAPSPPRGSGGRTKKVAMIAVGTLAFVGAVAFFMSQTAPAEERQTERSDELAAWEKAPPATVAPEVEAALTVPSNAPRDQAKLCAALQTVVDEEASVPDIKPRQKDFTTLRRWTEDRDVWWQAMQDMRSAGPPDAVPDIDSYQKTWEHYFQALYEASDSDLRNLADGVEMNGLKDFSDDIDDARDDVKRHVTAFCGDLQPG